MSFSVSAPTPGGATFDSPDPSLPAKPPVTKPTATQQILAMASGGQSAAIIASSLGLPITQVDSALGITSSATTQATALSALAGRLSVQA